MELLDIDILGLLLYGDKTGQYLFLWSMFLLIVVLISSTIILLSRR
jgi:uncharacterized membrane protein YdbT with pleckstrin-like domain